MVVTAIASVFWLEDAASFIYGLLLFLHSPRARSSELLSVVVTSRGHLADGYCVFEHTLRTRICIISTFISDLVLIALMISGVLRWKGVHDKVGTWWLLYRQVGLPHSADGPGHFGHITHSDH
jgi:hypothetical protein